MSQGFKAFLSGKWSFSGKGFNWTFAKDDDFDFLSDLSHWHGNFGGAHRGRPHHHPKPENPSVEDTNPLPGIDSTQAQSLLGLDTRNIDGSGNNDTHTDWGSAGSALLRKSPAAYADDTSTPYMRANPRDVSNQVLDQDGLMPNSFGASDIFTYFGQFIDHDVDLTPEGHTETMAFNHADGDFAIHRSGFIPGTGTDASNPREYPNVITSFVDGSNIYGSHEDVTSILRADGGTSPYLLTSADDFAPTLGQVQTAYPGLDPNNVGGGPLAAGGANPDLFVGGDVRANENIALTSMHTMWIREHNHQVDQLKILMPDAGNDELFKAAKLIVESEYQNIVFNEYLPMLVGAENIPTYQGYDPNVNPNVSIEFFNCRVSFGAQSALTNPAAHG